MTAPRTIWTVGHSNREAEDFIELLKSADIEQVADVRRFAASRRLPHFGHDALAALLASEGVGYAHLPALGGRRGKPAEDSPNRAWRVASFAAYADYMATDDFAEGLQALEALAADRPTAIMCSEAVPWRCHRRLVADALIVRGWEVFDVMRRGHVERRSLTDFARLRDGVLTYPSD